MKKKREKKDGKKARPKGTGRLGNLGMVHSYVRQCTDITDITECRARQVQSQAQRTETTLSSPLYGVKYQSQRLGNARISLFFVFLFIIPCTTGPWYTYSTFCHDTVT